MTRPGTVMMFRVVAVQDASVFLDCDAITDRVIGWMEQAVDAGAQVVAVPESFLPCYPFLVGCTNGTRFDDSEMPRDLASGQLPVAAMPSRVVRFAPPPACSNPLPN